MIFRLVNFPQLLEGKKNQVELLLPEAVVQIKPRKMGGAGARKNRDPPHHRKVKSEKRAEWGCWWARGCRPCIHLPFLCQPSGGQADSAGVVGRLRAPPLWRGAFFPLSRRCGKS